jgi:hypothetical protein
MAAGERSGKVNLRMPSTWRERRERPVNQSMANAPRVREQGSTCAPIVAITTRRRCGERAACDGEAAKSTRLMAEQAGAPRGDGGLLRANGPSRDRSG